MHDHHFVHDHYSQQPRLAGFLDAKPDLPTNTNRSATMPSWGIRYEAVDFQLSPANAFFGVWPEEEIRLQLDGYKPAAIFAGSFVL